MPLVALTRDSTSALSSGLLGSARSPASPPCRHRARRLLQQCSRARHAVSQIFVLHSTGRRNSFGILEHSCLSRNGSISFTINLSPYNSPACERRLVTALARVNIIVQVSIIHFPPPFSQVVTLMLLHSPHNHNCYYPTFTQRLY